MPKKLTSEQMTARKLVALRDAKEVSQAEAAKGAGVGKRSIERWESGEKAASTRNLRKLADYYGVGLGEILA